MIRKAVRDVMMNVPSKDDPPIVMEEDTKCWSCGERDCDCSHTAQETGFDAEGPSHPRSHGLLTVRIFEPDTARKMARVGSNLLKERGNLTPKEKGRLIDERGVHAEEHGQEGMDPHRRRTPNHGKFSGEEEPWGTFLDGGAQREDQGVGRSEASSDPFHRYNTEGGVAYGDHHDYLKYSARQVAKEMLSTGTSGAFHERYVPKDEDED